MANNDATSGHEQGQRLHVIAATVPVGAGQPGAVARGPFGAVGVLEAEDQRPAALVVAHARSCSATGQNVHLKTGCYHSIRGVFRGLGTT